MDHSIIDLENLLQELAAADRRRSEILDALRRWASISTPEQRLVLVCQLHRHLSTPAAIATEVALGLTGAARTNAKG